jgi:hypothetical protein
MGRTLATATQRVYEFEREWKMFARAPRRIDREAFAELCAFAHFYASAIAHATSPCTFEMILLTMLVGLVRRAEILDEDGIMQFYGQSASVLESIPLFQTNMLAIMLELRQRLATQGQELYTFARALRRKDQKVLRVLLVATKVDPTQRLPTTRPPTDEMLLASLVSIMRRIRQLEKQYMEGTAIVSAEEWGNLCAIR